MNTPITLGDAILIVIGILAIILLVYIIRSVRALIPVIRNLNKILEETEQITGMVSNAAVSVEDTIAAVASSSEDMAAIIRDNQKSFAAIINLINAVVAIKKLFSA